METKFRIIETPEYYLAVNDEEIKKGDYVYQVNFEKTNTQVIQCIRYFQAKIANDKNGSFTKLKIIAYQPKGNAKELDLPLLPEMVVADNVEKLAEEYADFSNDYIPISFGGKFNETSKRDFIAGYKAATKVYSEEDLRKAYGRGFNHRDFESVDDKSWKKFTESLKQPKTPKWFVAETKSIYNKEAHEIEEGKMELKTTTINGKTYLVGSYLFE